MGKKTIIRGMNPYNPAFLQFSKFGTVSIVATLIYAFAVIGWVDLLGVDPVISSIPSFCIAFVVAYFLNHRWTFSAKSQHNIYLPKYLAVQIIGLLFNLAIMYVTVRFLLLSYRIGLCIVILLVPLLTFFLNKRWVFPSVEH